MAGGAMGGVTSGPLGTSGQRSLMGVQWGAVGVAGVLTAALKVEPPLVGVWGDSGAFKGLWGDTGSSLGLPLPPCCWLEVLAWPQIWCLVRCVGLRSMTAKGRSGLGRVL